MPIKAKCKKCSQIYTVKDELAGKKFRCKQCQTAVTVPQPAVILEEEPEDDLFAGNDDFGGDDFGSFDDDFGDYEERPRPKKRKKKPVAKKKRRKKKSAGPGIGARIAAIIGGVIGFLFVLGLVIRIITSVGGGLDLGTSWKPYTTPDGNVTVLMPGTPKTVPAASVGPGGQSFGVPKRNYMCAITIEPMVGPPAGMSEEELFNAFEFGSGTIGAKNVTRSSLNGKNVLRFDAVRAGVKSENVAFVHKDKVYTLAYAYKGLKGSNANKFFNSVKPN